MGEGIVVIFIFIILVASATLTPDNNHLDLERIKTMVEKCDDNGGLDYIEHDYDVKCKNGAIFDYDQKGD